ncbi:NAD(P)-binding protein [Corynespora cassiicola Philippines]|uniref:NAD(P)-binding protein n=1 Tax=Corynespora cassiicola Philippines TaxID=1448308 RepID=A0A2T2N5K4_CORCC|nr:NAD(P)-binding protein [Corynespora cassiicola Philippines]
MPKQLLTIFGATGNQGGSVAHTVLSSPTLSSKYAVRAITRSATKPSAQALSSAGAEVIQADLNDPSTLPAALKDTAFLFAVTETNYGPNGKEPEFAQAKALADAAVEAGVEYIIWSSMSHPHKISGGKLTSVVHFDVKAEVEAYIRGLPVKSAFFAPGAFMQNFLGMQAPRPSPEGDGSFVLANVFPAKTKVPLIDITETGKWVAAILEKPDEYEGKLFAAAEGLYTFPQVVEIMSRVSGKTVKHVRVPDEVIKGHLPEGVRDMMYGMFVFQREYGYFGDSMEKDVLWAKEQAKGELTGLESFLTGCSWKLE